MEIKQRLDINYQLIIMILLSFEQQSSFDLLIKCVYECNENNHL